jgi:RNA polymerase sigma factor (sigma-70 family)
MSDKNTDIKSLEITSTTSNRGAEIAKFMPIVEMISRKEIKSKKYSNVMNYDELVNTGLIAINNLIEQAQSKEGTSYNSSYIAQSVKWAINDELRKRQGWYGVKRSAPTKKDTAGVKKDGINSIKTYDDAKAAVFEVIMSVEGMQDDIGFAPSDSSEDHLEVLELKAMKESLVKSVSKLPDNLAQVIKLRYFENKSGNEVAAEMNVTPSRISHMIREATQKLKVLMMAEGYS